MKRIVMAPYQKTHSSQDRDIGWFNHLTNRRQERDGAFEYDFNCRVVAYPERDSIEKINLPDSHLNHLMNPTTGAGITVELMGYGRAITCHLKLHLLPFIEVYVPIKNDECVIQEIPNFTSSTDDQKVAASLIKILLQTKGDSYAYANILITYYKRALEATKSAKKAILSKQESASEDAIYQKLTEEASKTNIDKFADDMDSYCYSRLKSTIGFDHVRRSLLLDDDLREYYNKFKTSFPTIHLAFYTIIESRYFNENEDSNDVDVSVLHKKQRMILFLFLATCRVKSVFLLKYWAIIEPLGMFYKGHQQLSSKSISGAFSATLPTSLAALESLYDNEIPDFYEHINNSPYLIGAFDNWQLNLKIKNITEHQSAVMHKATSYFLKEVKCIEIVKGSSVRSKSGLIFNVTVCRRHNDNDWFVKGDIYGFPSGLPSDIVRAEKELITKGMLLPLLDWTVIAMPGFSPRPPLEYHQQIVPPPRLAWISKDATDKDILFGMDRKLRKPTDELVESFSTKRMHRLLCMAGVFTRLDSHSKRIQRATIQRNEMEQLVPKRMLNAKQWT